MQQTHFKSAYILSGLIIVLAAIVSAGGLFINGLYRDNILITSAFRGNDLVTLVLAVSLMIGALLHSQRGSLRGQLVWLGTLGYMLYNYAFYLFGAAFNWFFWMYVALFSLSIFALVVSLPRVDADAIRQQFKPTTSVKWASGYIMFFALLLGSMWILRSLSFFLTGEIPQDIVQTGHPTAVVYALDLSLLVPSLVVSAVLLWKRDAWGFVLAPIMMIKATTYAFALIAMSAFADAAGVPNAWALVPLWIVLGAGGAMVLVFLLMNMQPENKMTQRN